MSRITIEGKPVLKVWESFSGWYWFATEKVDAHRWFGLVRGSEIEWGYWDERELKSLAPRIWEVPQYAWAWCPLVEEAVDTKRESERPRRCEECNCNLRREDDLLCRFCTLGLRCPDHVFDSEEVTV